MNELVFLFQKQKDPASVRAAADEVAAFLSAELGVPVRAEVPTSYAASVQALVSGTADIAYVSAIPFLLAKRDGGAELLLAEERTDLEGNARTDYDSVMVVRADSPLQSIEDLIAQAADLRFCFTSSTSTSGYVMAYWRLVIEGLLEQAQDPREVFAGVSFGGSYDSAVREVIAGRADVCAVSHYVVEGDSASKYLTDEELSQTRVLARTPRVPTHLVCVRQGLPGPLLQRVKAALLALSDAHADLLEDIYGAKRLVEVDPVGHVATAAEAIAFLGIDVQGLVE